MSKTATKFVHRNGVCNKFLEVNEKNINDWENNIKMFQSSKEEDPVEILKEELNKPLFNYNNNTSALSRNQKKRSTTKKNLTNPNLLLSSNNLEANKTHNYPVKMSSSKSTLNQNPCRNQEVSFIFILFFIYCINYFCLVSLDENYFFNNKREYSERY